MPLPSTCQACRIKKDSVQGHPPSCPAPCPTPSLLLGRGEESRSYLLPPIVHTVLHWHHSVCPCWILRPWWSIWDHTAGGKGRDWPRVRSDPGLADHRPASCPPHSQAGKRRPRKSCIVQPFRACFPVWSGWQAAMLLAQCGITSWPSSQSRLVLKVKYTECRSLHPSNLARAHFPCIPSSCCL